ncbi:hypothetical protein Ga0609869_002293 [Rhodovulum iodosum]|uniref:PAS domain-containing protein n=1 Tax=Rhodovulum iodosum TaxID=68291 RepID=A0ABV3XUD2_9RHOB|nr:PAS domain-containing protein [Rhodovulum robiginosum]RSK34994.1 PAS domain-containing protein [Rhodovulum robiginosum]
MDREKSATAQICAFRRKGLMQDFATLATVEAYWEGVRGGRPCPPPRAAIDPRGLEGALSGAFLVERIAPGQARLRIAGRDLAAMMGMDTRGMPLSALFLPEARARLEGVLELLFDGPARLEVALAAPGAAGAPRLKARMLLLPLCDREGHVSRALGALELAGDVGRAPPRRMAIAGCHSRPLDAAAPFPGLAEGRAGFAPAPRLRGRPRLVLVRSANPPRGAG